MKKLFTFLYRVRWIIGISLVVYFRFLAPPLENPQYMTPVPAERTEAKRPAPIPTPNPPEPGHYEAAFLDEVGNITGGVEIFLPAAPPANRFKSKEDFRKILQDAPVTGWVLLENQGAQTYFPVEYRAWLVGEQGKTLLFEVYFGEDFRWITEKSRVGYSGKLEGGGRLQIRRLGSYNEDLVNARAWHSMRKFEALVAKNRESERSKDAASPTWLKNTLQATGDFLSDPEVQKFLVEAVRYAFDAKFGQNTNEAGLRHNAETNHRAESVNPNQHIVRPKEGSAYLRTNPDGNPYNNFNPPR